MGICHPRRVCNSKSDTDTDTPNLSFSLFLFPLFIFSFSLIVVQLGLRQFDIPIPVSRSDRPFRPFYQLLVFTTLHAPHFRFPSKSESLVGFSLSLPQ
jgi:hypothetical protein